MDQRPDWARGIAVCALLLFAFLDPLRAIAQTSGLAASWTLDEGAGTSTADASGNANTGALTGSPTWAGGHSGNALNFNNLNSYVNVAPSSSINNLPAGGGVTVMAWINAASTGEGGSGRIVVKGSLTGTSGFAIKMVSGPKVQLVGGFSTSTMTRTSAANITLNNWVHVAATWTGSATGTTAHIYINGVLSDGTAVDGAGTPGDDSSLPLTIGNQTDLTRGFNGLIDDARVYNRVLTAAEIQTIFNDSIAPSAPAGLAANAVSSTQINLSWGASTDNVAVTSYLIERCPGAGCSNLTQIATATGTAYNDSGRSVATSYSYRVRAQDAAANFSAYSSTASATTQSAPSGPVGYWKFDEGSGTTTADSSGNANTGTLTGSPAWTSGSSGNALNFNNLNSYVNVPPAASLNSLYASGAGMTAMARIKAASAGESSGGRIVKKSAVGAGYTLKMISGNKLQFVAEFPTTTLTRSSAAAVTLNSWQHVALTWTGAAAAATAHIYINGTVSDGATVDGVGTIGDDAPNPLTLGNQTDLTRGFDGAIDEVRLYNRVLTQSEIQAISSDGAAPSVPSGLTASAVSSSQINLSWTASTDNVAVTGYLIERCQGASCTSFAQIASPTTTSYSDTGLSASISYSYRVRALDAAYNSSAYSSTATATTAAGGGGDITAPSAPSNLSAAAASSTQINLSWTASTDNVAVTGYRVERCQGVGCSNFAQIATPGTTTYSDTGLAASTSYSYRVRATDAASNLSGYSNNSSATTPQAGAICD